MADVALYGKNHISALLIRPPPVAQGDLRQQESMASWLFRLAQDNGFLSIGGFLREAGLKIYDLSAIDMGSNLDQIVDTVSQLSQLPREAVSNLTLASLISLFDGSEDPTGHPWVLRHPRGAKGSMHVCCTSCLRSDKVPYWRRSWRLAITLICPIHHHRLIDSCRACGAPIVLARDRSTPLHQCHACLSALASGSDRPYRRSTPSWLQTASPPISAGALPLPLADSSLWWMGIRSILFVLLSPRTARRLCCTEIPSTYLRALRLIAGNPRLDFQQHSLATRLNVLRFVVWLLDSWPARFVAVMRESRICASDFLLQESYVPYWLAQVCRTELNGKRYQVSPAEVAAAADALSSSVDRPSKIAVKRLLGVTEGKALDALMPNARPPLSTAEVESVMLLMDSDIRTLPSARDEQASAIRDACCIAMMSWHRCSYRDLPGIRLPDGLATVQQWHAGIKAAMPSAPFSGPTIELFAKWGDLYVDIVRPRFSKFATGSDALFLTRFGGTYQGTTLPARIASLLERVGIKDRSRGVQLLLLEQPLQ